MVVYFNCSVYSFADDNSLSNIATIVARLKQALDSECKVAIKWSHENNMIVNPDEFQATVLDKSKSNNTEVKFVISSEKI